MWCLGKKKPVAERLPVLKYMDESEFLNFLLSNVESIFRSSQRPHELEVAPVIPVFAPHK